MLDSDDEEELRALPEEEQRLTRRTKAPRRYAPSQTVVKGPSVVEESNVAMLRMVGCASYWVLQVTGGIQ